MINEHEDTINLKLFRPTYNLHVTKSQKNVFLVPAVPKTYSFKNCFLNQRLNSPEFNYEMWKAKFPSDKYEIWLLEKDNQNNYIPLFSQKIIQL